MADHADDVEFTLTSLGEPYIRQSATINLGVTPAMWRNLVLIDVTHEWELAQWDKELEEARDAD